MVVADVETISFADLSRFKIHGYKLDEDVIYNTETVSYTEEDNEDNYIEFTMTSEFDTLGYEKGTKGLIITIIEKCSTVEVLHFPAETSWNVVQVFLDRKFGNE